MTRSSLSIDAERFLLLTLALAAANCEPARQRPARQADESTDVDYTAQASAPVTIVEPKPQPVDTEPFVPDAAAPEQPIQRADPGCENSLGDVDCTFVDQRFAGPQCEGFGGSCELLKRGYGYKPRVAAAIARCWERRGPASCNMTVRTQCIRASLSEACPDASFRPVCEAVLQRCQQEHKRPDFSLAECVSALSSLDGDELEWAKSAMGPSHEGCKLAFTVY